MNPAPTILLCTTIAGTEFVVKVIPRARGYVILACRGNRVIDRLRMMRGPDLTAQAVEPQYAMEPMMNMVRSIIRRHAFLHQNGERYSGRAISRRNH